MGNASSGQQDLSNEKFLPPIGNQESIGSCVAWATGYGLTTYEAARALNTTPAQPNQYASPLDTYLKTIEEHRRNGQIVQCGPNGGTRLDFAMNVLTKNGVGSESEFPYGPGCYATGVSAKRTFVLNSSRFIKPSEVDKIKNSIDNHHPVAFGISLTHDFQNYQRGQIYSNPSSDFEGGHAMLIVGYDDSKQAYKVQNSWGANWGDSGYCWIKYSAVARDGNGCVTAETGATPNPPEVTGNVSFSSVQALQYYSISGQAYLLVMPFELSEPMYVTSARLLYIDGNLSTPWQPIYQWVRSTYFWLGSYYNYLPGTYAVELAGNSSTGNQIDISASATLTQGGYIRSGNQHFSSAEMTDSQRVAFSKLYGNRKRNEKDHIDLGEPVIINGHPSKWQRTTQ
ncbi:MAG: C1 family peptidase [Armatimonadetes bacterium]|nr:C1 family peptidase [Armatimonadota bacterium]